MLNLLQGILLLSILLSRPVSFPQTVFTHKEIRVVTVNQTSSLRWTGFCLHFFLICATCLMTCANFDLRKWQCFNQPRTTTSRCIPIRPGLWRELVLLAKLKTKRHSSHWVFLDRLVPRSIRGRCQVWINTNDGRTRYWLCELLFGDIMGWMPWAA